MTKKITTNYWRLRDPDSTPEVSSINLSEMLIVQGCFPMMGRWLPVLNLEHSGRGGP